MPIVGLMLLFPTMIALQKWIQPTPEDEKVNDESKCLLLTFTALVLSLLFNISLPFFLTDKIVFGLLAANLAPLAFPLFFRHTFSEDAISRKVASGFLLLFSLQCGLVSLVCFPQGLLLLMSSFFITLPFVRHEIPGFLMLLAHPIILAIVTYSGYQMNFGHQELPGVGELKEVLINLYSNENSNLYQLWMYSVLPIWSSLWTFHALKKGPEKLKAD
jgi:hypothetical protein